MVIRPVFSYGSPFYRELYKSILIFILTIWISFTMLDRHEYITAKKPHTPHSKRNILTVKSHITQNYIKFYDTILQMSSPLFSIIWPLNRTIWHNSRMIDITEQSTGHLHRWRTAPLTIFNTIWRAHTLQKLHICMLHQNLNNNIIH